MNKLLVFTWIAKVALAGLFFIMALPKFGGAELTIHIFTTLGIEPWGRYATGLIEAAIAVLILIPFTAIYGILLASATIIGALLAHFTVLGIVVQNAAGTVNDGGEVFATAIIISILVAINLVLHKDKLPLVHHSEAVPA